MIQLMKGMVLAALLVAILGCGGEGFDDTGTANSSSVAPGYSEVPGAANLPGYVAPGTMQALPPVSAAPAPGAEYVAPGTTQTVPATLTGRYTILGATQALPPVPGSSTPGVYHEPDPGLASIRTEAAAAQLQGDPCAQTGSPPANPTLTAVRTELAAGQLSARLEHPGCPR
jgi:hypothetical protein